VNKPKRRHARALSDLIGPCLGDTFARQGFVATEIVTRWPEVVGREIADHAEPIRIQWPRGGEESGATATLVLRVEGPIALEIQHQSGIILERVNRFFGWQAVGRLALRQAPLARRSRKTDRPMPDAAATAEVAATLPETMDGDLRQALARLGAAIKRT
jgi:hypothetical protein